MKKINIKKIIIILIIGSILFFGFIKFRNNKMGPTVKGAVDNDVCKAVGVTDDYGFNLVFYNDAYEDQGKFNEYAAYLISVMKNIEPFKSYSNINFFTINNADKNICESKKNEVGVAQVKCSEDIIKFINKCNLNNFRLVVLTKDNTFAYSIATQYKSSIMVLPVEKHDINDLDKIFLRELGHLFGLAYENGSINTEAGSNDKPLESFKPNCAPDVKTAEEWWGKYVGEENFGYYLGCDGNNTYIKPIKKGIMANEIKHGYGKVSEEYIEQILECYYTKKPSKLCSLF